MAPKMLAICLEIPPGRPKSRSKDFFRLQEAKKRVPKKVPKKGPAKERLTRLRYQMECPAECAGPVLAHLSLFRPEYAKRPGSTPSTTRGGRRIAHAHSARPGPLERGPLAKEPSARIRDQHGGNIASKWLQHLSKMVPIWLQNEPWRPPGGLLEASWRVDQGEASRSYSERFCHHASHASSLKAPSPRALDPCAKPLNKFELEVHDMGSVGTTTRIQF